MKPGDRDSLGRRFTIKPKQCAVCGEEFQPTNGIQKYCSPGCVRQGNLVTQACERCGEDFTWSRQHGLLKRRFCSPKCANQTTAEARAGRLRKHRPLQMCEQCGEPFAARRIGQKFCSQKCNAKTQGERRRGRKRQPAMPRGWGLKFKGETRCRNCGDLADHLHHIVPRGKTTLGKVDLRNGMPLCFSCHRGWHDKAVTITRDKLTAAEEAFALEISDPVWMERNYPYHEGDSFVMKRLSVDKQVELVNRAGGIEAAVAILQEVAGAER